MRRRHDLTHPKPAYFFFLQEPLGVGPWPLAQEVLFFFPRMMCLRRGAIGRVFLTIVRSRESGLCARLPWGAKMPLFAPSVASQSGRNLQKLAARAARLRSLRAGTAPRMPSKSDRA